MSTDTQTCRNCKYFVPDQWVKGECHRHAPITSAEKTGYTPAIWPQTRNEDWCGDWEQAIPDAPR